MNFSFMEEGADKGNSIREKATLLCDLMNSPQRLEDERGQARQYRMKFYPNSRGLHGEDGGFQGGY